MITRFLPLSYKRYRNVLREEFQVYLHSGDKKPLVTQARELAYLYRLYQFLPYQYLVHNLYLRRFGQEIFRYIPTELLHNVRDALNEGADLNIVEDKLLFEKTIRTAGLETTHSLFRVTQDSIHDLDGRQVSYADFVISLNAMKLAGGVIVKPLSGGSGSAVFKLRAADGTLLHNGTPLDEKPFRELIFTTNDGGYWLEFLVQEAIVQHPEIARFNASSVNTIRIDTFVGDDGSVRFNAAGLKIGAPGCITDNAATGGYVISIDLETGQLRSGAMRIARYGGQYHDILTVFGVDPTTFVVPFWQELRRMMIDAAGALAPLRSLGWDVAITPTGPLIIETNADYGIFVLQELSGGYVDKPLGQFYLQHHCANKARIMQLMNQS